MCLECFWIICDVCKRRQPQEFHWGSHFSSETPSFSHSLPYPSSSSSFPRSIHPSGLLCIGHGMMETACAGHSDWLDHVFCWHRRPCAATMRKGMLSQGVSTSVVKTEINAVSGQLTGWLLETFGRVDDHMQKAVQARSLLIWKTSTQSS